MIKFNSHKTTILNSTANNFSVSKGKNYIFLGSPGVGKGTLATIWSRNSHLIHLSTGEIFRQEIALKTKLGKKISEIVVSGQYVPDELTNEIIKKQLLTKTVQTQGFILDGYPRTLNQVDFLQNNQIKIDYVIYLTAPKSIILQRLINRKRLDDNPDVIEQRIEIYNQKTKPIIDYYRQQKKLLTIDVSGNIEQNYQQLIEVVDNQEKLVNGD